MPAHQDWKKVKFKKQEKTEEADRTERMVSLGSAQWRK